MDLKYGIIQAMTKAIKVMEIHFELHDFDFQSLHGVPWRHIPVVETL
jgi:hypothetical protein